MGRLHKAAILLALIVIIVCAWMGLKAVFIGDNDAEVPDVVGLNVTDAVDTLQMQGLMAHIDAVDSSAAKDTVISQNLAPGEHISRGKVIILRISKGGTTLEIPDVRDLAFEEGVQRLSAGGFKVGSVTRVDDKAYPAGTIIAQNPAAPQKVPSSHMVNLLVSSGTKSATFVTVPDLRGKDKENALEILDELGLTMGNISEEPSNSAPAGSIIGTRPKKDARVPSGASVNLILAREPSAAEAERPPVKEEDKERAAIVRRVVVKDTTHENVPSKFPEVKKAEPKPEKKAAAKQSVPKEEKKADVKHESAKQEPQETVKQEETQPAAGTKTARVRYQVPPLSKPLSLKIEITDGSGTRVLKNGPANSGEYISINAPYTGDACVTIYLGGDFVWQDRYN